MAFDWIESHRGLKDHPKTVLLTAAWNDRKPCVLGHLHELWWWTLEYAPDGIIRPSFVPQVIAACEWHGKNDRFWGGLVESGFLDQQADGSYLVHDWDEYALRRIQRHEQENKRKQEWRAGRAGKTGPDAPVPRDNPPDATSGATGPTRARHQPDLPDRTRSVLTGPTPTPSVAPDVATDAQGAPPTASAPPSPQLEAPPPRWEELAAGQFRGTPNGQGDVSLLVARCPLCERRMPVAEIEDHPCHPVLGAPVETPNYRPHRGVRRLFGPAPDAPPPDFLADRPTPEQIAAEVASLLPHD